MDNSAKFIDVIRRINLKKAERSLSWVVMISAYAYVFYVLATFNNYSELWSYWRTLSATKVVWLSVVLLLLPLNLVLESLKWKKLISNTEQMSLSKSFKSVLAGFSTGFFTPNRTGEFAGRILFMDKQNRKTGVVYSIINSLTQNMAIVICGVPAAVFFFAEIKNGIQPDLEMYFLALLTALTSLLTLYFKLPQLANTKHLKPYISFAADLELYSKADLFHILFLSLCRFVVFSIQFYAILQCFGVNLEVTEALIAIPANYLFVTITPSFAFSEAAVRSSYAVFFISAFSTQTAGIALAGIGLWLINFGIPMLAGATMLMKKR